MEQIKKKSDLTPVHLARLSAINHSLRVAAPTESYNLPSIYQMYAWSLVEIEAILKYWEGIALNHLALKRVQNQNLTEQIASKLTFIERPLWNRFMSSLIKNDKLNKFATWWFLKRVRLHAFEKPIAYTFPGHDVQKVTINYGVFKKQYQIELPFFDCCPYNDQDIRKYQQLVEQILNNVAKNVAQNVGNG